MRDAAVAEGSYGPVDDGNAWVGEAGVRQRSGFGEIEDAADSAGATVSLAG